MIRQVKGIVKKEIIRTLRHPQIILFEIMLPIISFIPLLITTLSLRIQSGDSIFVQLTGTQSMINYFFTLLFYLIFVNLSEGSGYLLQNESEMGTLEQIIISPYKSISLILGWYSFLLLKMIVYFLIFATLSVFVLDLSALNPLLLLISFLFMMIYSFGLGIIITAITLRFKQADAIVFSIVGILPIISCVTFPIELLNDNLQFLSRILPTTYLFDLIKHSLSGSYLMLPIYLIIIILSIGSVVFIFLSVLFYKNMFRRIKKCGTIYV